MPIENERKYVLPLDFDAAALSGWTKYDIRQGYLDDGPRIRRRNDAYIFTYKKWIRAAGELVEIETAISREDFDMLWPLCVESLQKTRYERHLDNAEWVIDFLRDADGEVYFVMAEAELPRGVLAPETVPDVLLDVDFYAVDAGDNGFTNKKLADPEYAAKLYSRINLDKI